MNNSQRIREEILTLIVFFVTLVFTSSNFTAESLKDQSGANNNFSVAELNY